MTITIYHFAQSRSIRVAWLLEEMGVPYDLKIIPRDQVKEYAQSPEYQALNPLGKFPTMVDGDVTMIESIAIMEYLMAKHDPGTLRPDPTDSAFPAYLQWLHFGESGMGTYVIMLMAHTYLLPEEHRLPGVAQWAKAEVNKCLSFIARGLEGQDYLCSTGFTAADISVGYMLFLLKITRNFDQAPEILEEYWDRLMDRPAWDKVSRR